MNRDNLWRLLSLLLAAACIAWLVSCTEWAEVDVHTPAKGEAAKNELYALQRLAQQLGAEVTMPHELSQMPPPGATLLLSSLEWDLFPERSPALREWVQQGGHLVIFSWMLDREPLQQWLPIHSGKRQTCAAPEPQASAASSVASSASASHSCKAPCSEADDDLDADDDEDDEEDDETPADGPLAAGPAASGASEPASQSMMADGSMCHPVTEPDALPASYPPDRSYSFCGYRGYRTIQSKQPPAWLLKGKRGTELLRVAFGQGSVTVINNDVAFFNPQLLKGDNALIAVSALQIRRGALLWFVTEEARAPLLGWVWQQAAVAVLLVALALALWLWRAAVRFGPMAAEPKAGRRSMTEQITGTAQFLRRHGAQALHAAQLRALDESARNHVRHDDTLERSARAQAIARLTGLDAQALGQALDPSISRRNVDLPPVLEILETARRLLTQSAHRPRTEGKPHAHQSE